RVTISSPNPESIRKAIQKIRDITSDPEIGQIYEGIISRIEPYGCFAKIMSNTKEGLVHISEMHTSRINRVEDMVKMGDKIKAKVIGLDDGKVKLSMKGVEGNPEPVKSAPGDQPPDNRRRYDSSRPPRRDYSSGSRDNSSQRRERSYRPDRNKDE
ncbi:MAG: S1 RNA-binding domain-containing protein, partial [Candidatus Cloacimonetes bacterium]|nr:S1 RNA-binding domain-containing protein [Candidatus Cloacimonadota bacterium]